MCRLSPSVVLSNQTYNQADQVCTAYITVYFPLAWIWFQTYQQLLFLGPILMVMEVHQYSGMEGVVVAQARFKGCIGTNTKVEGGICQEEPGRPLHRLLRLLNGALLVSQGPVDNAVTLWGRILHLLYTKLHFGLWPDKSLFLQPYFLLGSYRLQLMCLTLTGCALKHLVEQKKKP